jgi:5'-phosphate synthase pdxT subunit
MLNRLTDGVSALHVRYQEDLKRCDALIMPGGESSCHRRLLRERGLDSAIAHRIEDGMMVWGTCSGMILLARSVVDAQGRGEPPCIPAIPITVRRNSYGTQIDSFASDLDIPELGDSSFEGVFIRAPRIAAMSDDVEVLSYCGNDPVLCRYKRVVVSSFHPELTEDVRLHAWFASALRASISGQHEIGE